MNLNKSEKRERKRNKRKNGMRVSGRSVFVIRNTINKRARKVKRKPIET